VPGSSLLGLYAGLMTDTGQFSYGNTRARTMRMAAEMLDRGLDCEELWTRIYLNKPWGELQLEARARASLQSHANGRLCSMALRETDFKETGTGPQHTEDFASIPRMVEGVELAIFMYELTGGQKTKISVRSTRDLDARELAKQFNGGGHRQAAGATVEGSLEVARPKVIAAAEKFLLSATK
jgi:phosphoesterase RecJ-like protein